MKEKNKKISFNVMMLGPRRIGKSSILASMVSSFEEVSQDTFIHIKPDNDTKTLLKDKLTSLKNIHEKKRSSGRTFKMDENQTGAADNFTFHITYTDDKGETKDLADVTFMDRPGEHLTDPETVDKLREEIGESDVLIIAIDTIHLMEEDGRFFSDTHRILDLHSVVSSSGFLKDKSGKKLVTFVPLKCERYYHEGRMDQVKERLRDKCGLLFSYFSANKVKDRVTIAITPILTIGGIEFDSFGRDANNKVITIKESPSKQLKRRPDPDYIFYRFYREDPAFKPKYCDQPVLYLLFYIASLAKDARLEKSDRIFDKLPGILQALLLIPFLLYDHFNTKNVSVSMKRLRSKIKTQGDGYEVVQNALQI